jgi:hypothetical protein
MSTALARGGEYAHYRSRFAALLNGTHDAGSGCRLDTLHPPDNSRPERCSAPEGSWSLGLTRC